MIVIITLTTENTQAAHTVTAPEEEIALKWGGQSSPTRSHGTRFIPTPYANINPLVSATVNH